MTKDKWFKLTPEACQIWDQLDNQAKVVILAPSSKNGTHTHRKVNLHEISAYDYLLANMHHVEDTPGVENPATVSDMDPAPPDTTQDEGQVLVNAAK